jgi:hypothetical protein
MVPGVLSAIKRATLYMWHSEKPTKSFWLLYLREWLQDGSLNVELQIALHSDVRNRE